MPIDPHRDDRTVRTRDDVLAAVAVLLMVWCAVLGARALCLEGLNDAQAAREHIAQTDR